jgi:Retroviral aspartyl protease
MENLPICVLIDTRATNYFINPRLVDKLQLATVPKPVKVYRSASGEKLLANKLCPKVKFTLQNHPFEADLKILNVPSYDVILGCDWIVELGDVKLNLMKGIMIIEVKGTLVKLCTEKIQTKVQMVEDGVNVKKEVQKGGQLFQIEEEKGPLFSDIEPAILAVLNRFSQVFAEFVGLPPNRAIDHKITLQLNTKLINLRLYRFSYFQKLDIDKITQELLQ